MKSLLTLLLCLLGYYVIGEPQDGYYYQGQLLELNKTISQQYIVVPKSIDTSAAKNYYSALTGGAIDCFESFTYPTYNNSTESTTLLNNYFWAFTNAGVPQSMIDNYQIQYVSSTFELPNGLEVCASNGLYIKLAQGQSIALLNAYLEQYKLTVIGQNPYMPQWYTLISLGQTDYEVVEIARYIYESGLVLEAQPDLMNDARDCTNDDLFGDLFHLYNNGNQGGTAGLDNNYCQVRTITSGSAAVKIAILDEGLLSADTTWHPTFHEDVTNISFPVYDSEKGTNEINDYGNHGIMCAGIIGANTNNNLGVAGIAPDCPMMSISNSLRATPFAQVKRADGINWAWQNGAAVISCSWHSAEIQLIADAIDQAHTWGRNGLGTVVVFSSANFNDQVYFPASYNPPLVIAVGAVDRCGIRSGRADIIPNSCDPWSAIGKPGSNYGPELDLVAQGSYIMTSKFDNISFSNPKYYKKVSGTSFAAPQVAAGAALIITVNPDLNVLEIADILESTTQKAGDYNYENVAGRPNGTWNLEVGYGMLDLYAAVLKAQNCSTSTIANQQITTNVSYEDCFIEVNNTHVHTGGRLELDATYRVGINENFSVELGSSLDISTGGQ